MPQIMGPLTDRKGGAVYQDVHSITLQYETTSDAIGALLPPCYQPTAKPIVTVSFMYNSGVGFMPSGGYNIAAILVQAQYDGNHDHVQGDYPLVMFENDTIPIIMGRERLGVSKLYADISPAQMLPNGKIRCEASLWGHLLFGIEIGPLAQQDPSVAASSGQDTAQQLILGYKYIPSPEGPPDAAYPICTPNQHSLNQLLLGETGHLFFGNATFNDIGLLKPLMVRLRTLSARNVVAVSQMRGSSALRVDLSKRLV